METTTTKKATTTKVEASKVAPEVTPEGLNITKEQYGALQSAFDYYNKELFQGELPRIMLTFSRRSKAVGFFVPRQWHTEDNTVNTHEISMNPDYMKERTFKQFYSTLVHEMCHLWQEVGGEPPRRCYHNKQFSDKMEACGLMTSNTGAAGGKRTGQNMTHYVMEGGKYEKAFEVMPKECLIPFIADGLIGNKKVKKSTRTPAIKYVCPVCGAALKGKGGLNIKCADCDEFMLETH